MANLRGAPPRPRVARVSPSYPRAIATLAVVLAGCGGVVENGANGRNEPEAAGGISLPYDAEPPQDSGADVKKDSGPTDTGAIDTGPLPNPAGDMPYPYEDTGPEDTGPAEDGGPVVDAATDPAPR